MPVTAKKTVAKKNAVIEKNEAKKEATELSADVASENKTVKKNVSAKKSAEKKAAVKKTAVTKSAAKKTGAKKTVAKKATAVKKAAVSVKAAAEQADETKSAVKKSAEKKATVKKAAAEKHKLVIVESPTKAKTIEKFLGKGYKVIASQGHVRDLPKSQLGVDIENDFDMKYITIRGRGDILAAIRKEAKAADKVLLATDPDREGEAISWHLAQLLGMDPAKSCRIEFHEITKNAIKEAITQPRPVDTDRVDAQQARRALDRLVGYKISPLLWAKVRKGLSAGRVQSVATKLVVEREEEIESFIPEEYWDVDATFAAKNEKNKHTVYTAHLVSIDGQKNCIRSAADADSVKERILKAAFNVSAIKEGKKQFSPQPPFTTSTLQQEASRKLNFSTAKTMQIVQQLYEGIDVGKPGTVGLVTYIRTDSVRVSEEAVSAARKLIESKYGEEYRPEQPNRYKGRSNAQDAHEAIRPTMLDLDPEKVESHLTKDQYKLYKLIYSRFIASQMMPALYTTYSVDLTGDNILFRTSGSHMIFPGYTAVYKEGSDEENKIAESYSPVLEENKPVSFLSVDPSQHFTQPPARYTEASLVKTLEEKGIGRPSTYAPIITTIISRGYVCKEKKQLVPTELGRMVTSLMKDFFNPIIDTEFTADLENKLDTIEEGSAHWKQILQDFYPPFEKMLEKAETEVEKVEIRDEVSDVPCDLCNDGTMMVIKNGRFGKFLACPNYPKCRNSKPILHYIDALCPKCGGRLLEKTTRKNRKFYGCEKYPECDFTSWEMPIAEKCPKCGSYMIRKFRKPGEDVHICANESCRYKETVHTKEEDE